MGPNQHVTGNAWGANTLQIILNDLKNVGLVCASSISFWLFRYPDYMLHSLLSLQAPKSQNMSSTYHDLGTFSFIEIAVCKNDSW